MIPTLALSRLRYAPPDRLRGSVLVFSGTEGGTRTVLIVPSAWLVLGPASFGWTGPAVVGLGRCFLTGTVGALMLGTDPTLSLKRYGNPRFRFIWTVSSTQSSLKCAEQINDEEVSVKSERVLLTNRTHARRVDVSFGNVSQKMSGFFALLRVHPPTTHDTGILWNNHWSWIQNLLQ